VSDPLADTSSIPRRESLRQIRSWAGDFLPASDLRDSVPGFKAQKGIYKPADSPYALWVRETHRGSYLDAPPSYLADGSWTYEYAPEGRSGRSDMSLATNRGLLRCRDDHVPVGVFRQESSAAGQTTYKVLGLAYVESYQDDRFILRGEPIDETQEPAPAGVVPPFTPFEPASSPVEEFVRKMRDRRFGSVVREVYHDKCSLCALGYRYHGRSLALEAAHVIPVESRGIIGDVRNGILLCRNHHSLFDSYAWTLDEQLRVVVTEDTEFRESAVANHILKLAGQRLPNLPESTTNYPAQAAIDWRLAAFNERQ
jgi:putative restriction endonuclease